MREISLRLRLKRNGWLGEWIFRNGPGRREVFRPRRWIPWGRPGALVQRNVLKRGGVWWGRVGWEEGAWEAFIPRCATARARALTCCFLPIGRSWMGGYEVHFAIALRSLWYSCRHNSADQSTGRWFWAAWWQRNLGDKSHNAQQMRYRENWSDETHDL